MINLKNLFAYSPPPPIFGYLILSSLIKPVLANFFIPPLSVMEAALLAEPARKDRLPLRLQLHNFFKKLSTKF